MPVGKRLTHPPPGEEIVISGISGYFPESEGVYHLRENLFNQVYMATNDNRRWTTDPQDTTQVFGKLLDLAKFDASFFGIHFQRAHFMDPMIRMMLERTYEAIVDAGVNPQHLKGQRVGVFVGCCCMEAQASTLYFGFEKSKYFVSSCAQAMVPNGISYWLGVNGPSYTLDSACASSLYALEEAYLAISSGLCESAIVGGCNLCLHPLLCENFFKLGVISPYGICKSFDRDASGYVRSEAVVSIFVQKAREAKRIYARVVHAKSNCDGYKDQGITYPSGASQKELVEAFYEECGVNPASIDYLEAHGTGTKVGDPEELNSMDSIFCKGRTTPLPIGSVKSNLGHSEPASGLCSISKVIIAMETGFVPPNLHYSSPREGVPGLKEGRLKVITEKYPLDCRLVGINSFGFGGANAHVLLQWNEKNKINGGAPQDCLPRLVVASGRTEEAVDVILNDFESRPTDAEFVSLMQDLQSQEIIGHFYRGYTLLTQDRRKVRDIQYCSNRKRPVWFVFTGMGSQWTGMGKSLLNIPIFAAAIEKCQKALKPHGLDLYNIITSDDPGIFDNVLNCFVGIAACQVGLVDILRAVDIIANGVIGHSVGELGCSYHEGCFTAEQAVLTAYYSGRAVMETKLSKGLMAVVGMSAEQVQKFCPSDIEVTCYYGPDLCVLSGPIDSLKNFVATLKQRGVFAEEINCANVACHSRHIAKAGPALLKYLKQVIPNPKPRPAKWVSSSVPRSAWSTALATHSSAEYHTNSLLSPVLFQEASRHIPVNAITIEIAPHGLLQAILHRSLAKTTTNIALTQREHPDCTEFLLAALGKLFELGLQPKLTKLYPTVEYPVSRGTRMISPLVRWCHSIEWDVNKFSVNTNENMKSSERSVNISLEQEDMRYLSGHVIDGRNLFPATGYIVEVWECFARMCGCLHTDMSVVFENVRFHRATNIPKEGSINFVITVHRGSGRFEVSEGGTAVVTGIVKSFGSNDDELMPLPPPEHSSSNNLIELNSRDIYKELRLHGYNYHGLFRSLVSMDGHGKAGKIHWSNNWVTFMDNLLQINIAIQDTRSLFVPTSVEKLTIDVKKHAVLVSKIEDEALPVQLYPELRIVRSGGVEVRGLRASGIARRKPLGVPVLEKYVFVPNAEPESLDLHTALRVCMHITLENQTGIQVKAVELNHPGHDPLSPTLSLILGDLPLIQADITLLADAADPAVEVLEIVGYSVQERKLTAEENCTLVIASHILSNPELFKAAVGALAEGACILDRERPDAEIVVNGGSFGMQIVFEKTFKDEKLILLKKGVAVTANSAVVIHVSEKNYEWLDRVQAAVSNAKQQIILVAQGEPLNGIIGLVNCIRKEPGGECVRCVFIMDASAPAFDVNIPMYYQQLKKNLAINVYNNGKWGSYRHLPLDVPDTVPVTHAYANVTTRGDLSSMKWMQGYLDYYNAEIGPDKELVYIYYSSLNFRDVMNASGKLASELTVTRMKENCILGFEFCGRNQKGQRVMGMTASDALASKLVTDKTFLWNIPEHWTLEDAATVPVVYGTVYYALVMKGQIKRGESILIHAGTGGVGQAAINVCLHLGCTVFTTVGTEEKREFIKKTFPQLTDRNIGNSRDTTFEQLVMLETNGRGVDIVLNSLAEEKLQASVRCLASRGRFLEIGKFDLNNNSPLGMELFLEGKSFHGVMLDSLFTPEPREEKKELHTLVTEGIKSGAVKPLVRTVFPMSEVEQAFRFMAAGKHIGKVTLQIRPEEDRNSVAPSEMFYQAAPRFYCNPHCTYVIAGGLGGFGLELVDWLVLRGARKLVLNSRSGLKTGYQSSRVKIWRSYGSTVVISRADITTKEGVKTLLSEANRIGPVDAIFNLAVVLRDALFEHQTETDFVASARPKAHATLYMDELSREMCPQLRHFVVFSSVSCGRGNAGQTNYGMSNSIMERICEARVRDGFPGLAVQWGAVGEVGLVAEMQEDNTEIVIGGTLPQKISSCLEELDGFMRQSCPIVASMVVAEKRAGGSDAEDVVECVSNILGIRDLTTVSLHSTLSELGMDSLMAVEIKQTFERSFEVFLTAQEIRNLTFTRLAELNTAIKEGLSSGDKSAEETNIVTRDSSEGLMLLQQVIGDETTSAHPILRLPSASGTENDVEGQVLFMVPGIEGMASVFESLASYLKYQTYCLQLGYSNMGATLQDLAMSLLPHITNRLPPGVPFKFLGFSFGGLLAMELVLELEKQGREGCLYLVDSSPDVMKKIQALTAGSSEDELEINFLKTVMTLLAAPETSTAAMTKVMEEIMAMKDWEERVEKLMTILPKTQHSKQHQKAVYTSVCARLKALGAYKWTHNKRIKSHTTLIRPTTVSFSNEENYGLSQYCEKLEVHFVKGNHMTILKNKDTADLINK